MWNVVLFEDEGQVEVVPTSWVGPTSMTCFWPQQILSSSLIVKMVARQEAPTSSWTELKVRILGKTYSDYHKAEEKCKIAIDTSDLTSEDGSLPVSRKKFPNRKYSVEEEEVPRKIKKMINPFPSPPALENAYSIDEIYDKPGDKDNVIEEQHGEQNVVDYPTTSRIELGVNTKTPSDNKEFQMNVLRELKTIKIFQQSLMGHIEEIKNILINQQASTRMEDLKPLFDTSSFPLQTKVELDIVEGLLSAEPDFKNLVMHFISIGGTNPKSMCGRILMHVMSNELGSTFNWHGKSHNKSSFSSLGITRALITAIQRSFPEATVHDLEVFMKNWLRHAPSRVGTK